MYASKGQSVAILLCIALRYTLISHACLFASLSASFDVNRFCVTTDSYTSGMLA